jgi:hypothetical protein
MIAKIFLDDALVASAITEFFTRTPSMETCGFVIAD